MVVIVTYRVIYQHTIIMVVIVTYRVADITYNNHGCNSNIHSYIPTYNNRGCNCNIQSYRHN